MRSFKNLLIIVMTVGMFNAMADTKAVASKISDSCIQNYMTGTIDLAKASRDFNARISTPGEFSARVTIIRAKVGAVGIYCKNTQAPNKVKCIKSLEKNYDKLNSEISVVKVMNLEQDLIKISIIDAAEGLLNHGKAILTCMLPGM
jgi:hypothetical protein